MAHDTIKTKMKQRQKIATGQKQDKGNGNRKRMRMRKQKQKKRKSKDESKMELLGNWPKKNIKYLTGKEVLLLPTMYVGKVLYCLFLRS